MTERATWATLLAVVLAAWALCLSAPVCAARLHPEAWYQDRFCEAVGGETEHVLADLACVDCLTDSHAWEVDFANKWAEGIGQALYYGAATGRQPGIVIIVEHDSDDRYLRRLFEAIARTSPAISIAILWRANDASARWL